MLIMSCARCGHSFEIDCGGYPGEETHPFFGHWICDDCEDDIIKIQAEIKRYKSYGKALHYIRHFFTEEELVRVSKEIKKEIVHLEKLKYKV